ncbi:hypothetical protein IW148_005619 [Coemansia sp. RSA 1199]|nr:hypothetical protein IW148_005619 [Coemansia sp. RSA 1199]
MTEQKNVVVAVRCRPMNSREKQRGAQVLVSMDKHQTTLQQPALDEAAAASTTGSKRSGGRRHRTYNFDYSYWTAGSSSDPRYASQETVFNDIGQAVLGHALSGYHCCVFAYGQTGSGKSYTMMGGSGRDAGLIPRISQQLFARIDSECQQDKRLSFRVEVSYLEIYNERVRDLLNPLSSESLRVREHPSLGPYVEDLTKAAVSTYSEMLAHMIQGNKARTVAATNMNATSSRSHAVYTVVVTRRTADLDNDDQATERVSRISLVDLAGSERANSTMATGVRLKEGARINQSLAALGKVISALADQQKKLSLDQNGSLLSQQQQQNASFVPYRDSVLTWLLKDSLGGNSRTFMIATISPADHSETLSTLRYADRAKHIVNVATVNEDATVKMVRQLKEEIAELRRRLAEAVPAEPGSGSGASSGSGHELEEQLAADEKLVAELNQSWEEKLRRTQTLQQEREQALQALGIAVDMNRQGLGVGLHAPRDIPHLVNLNEDPLMSECLVYNIKPGTTVVGCHSDEAEGGADIQLGGDVAPRHCFFDYDLDTGVLTVHPVAENLVLVNGQRIGQPMQLKSGYRIIIGTSFVFRLNHPQQARKERRMQAQALAQGNTTEMPTGDVDYAAANGSSIIDSSEDQISDPARPSNHSLTTDHSLTAESDDYAVDWHYAWNEAYPDFAGPLDMPNTGRYSPSTWSDTQSEVSEVHESAAGGSVLAGLQHYAHLYGIDTNGGNRNSVGARPSSQLSFRRNAGLAPRLRRDSVASDAGGLAALQHNTATAAYIPLRRSRGQTLSIVHGANSLGSPQLGLRIGAQPMAPDSLPSNRFSRRIGMSSLTNTPIPPPLRPLGVAETRERMFYERRLARLVIQQWRRYKLVKVGEQMLRNAIHIKEANVIGKELGQKVVYQFAILRGGASSFPESPLEPDALPALLSEDWDAISINETAPIGASRSGESWRFKALDNPSSESTVPEVVIKVLDIAHTCWYVWSLAEFHDRLDKMRRLSTVKGSYRAHLVLDPFHANPAPRYSCIGTATYPIWPGDRPYSAKIDAPVVDLLSGLERGRTTGSLAALPVRNRDGGSGSISAQPLRDNACRPRRLSVSPKAWRVIVHIKLLHGVSESDMTGVHCRLRLVRIPGLLSSTRSDKPLISPILSPIMSPGHNPPSITPLPVSAFSTGFADNVSDMLGEASREYLGRENLGSSPVMVSSSLEQASRVNRPISGFGEGPVNIEFRQQWTVDMLTEDTCVMIEFFADMQAPALRRAFHEDVQIEESLRAVPPSAPNTPNAPNAPQQHRAQSLRQRVLSRPDIRTEPVCSSDGSSLSASQNLLVERLHEEELFVDSQHEIIMWIRVMELGPDGEWECAPCIKSHISPAYLVRQGVQRRVEIIISHHASQNLRISGATELRIGNPVLVDEKGRLVSATALTPSALAALPISQVQLAEENDRVDNRSFISVSAPWDTSVYGSRLLDTPTNRRMRVKLSLQLHLAVENGAEPLVLPTELYAQVYSRQSKVGRSWLASLGETASDLVRSSMNIARIPSDFMAPTSSIIPSHTPIGPSPSRMSLSSYSISNMSLYTTNSSSSDQALPPLNDPVFRVFSVTLSPINPARGKDSLWRLNTGKKYVRGEETLLPWQPRSVQFVNEYYTRERMDAWRLIVARSRSRLAEVMPSIAPLTPDERIELRSSVLNGNVPMSLGHQRVRNLVLEAVRRLQTFRRVPSDAATSGLGLQQDPMHSVFSTEVFATNGSPDSRRISLASIRQLIRRHVQLVRPIHVQGHFCHRGYVDVLDTNSEPDMWTRRWFVVERPYLFMFTDRECVHLDNVVNISSARISIDQHVSDMVGRPNVLALYTSTNSFLISPPEEEVQQWISAIDEWYFML